MGLAIAIRLQERGHSVTVIASRWPGEGITGDLAAGTGYIIRTSSERAVQWAIDSYPVWMSLARDTSCSPVVVSTMTDVVPKASPDPIWKDTVEQFERVRGDVLRYVTYAFDPVGLGQWRLERLRELGGELQSRQLTPDEIAVLRQRQTLANFEHTVVSIGMELRQVVTDPSLYPVRGVLVHYDQSRAPGRSFSDEEGSSYMISRPGGAVVGGTFDEHVGTCSEEEKLTIGKRIVEEANRRFDLDFDFAHRTAITAGYRPATPGGDPIVRIEQTMSAVGGLAGQGWVTGPALAADVSDSIERL